MQRISLNEYNMFIYEYIAKSNNNYEYRKNEYIVNDFINGVALSFDEAIEKYNIAYREVGCGRNYTCNIIQHNTDPIPFNKLNMDLRGHDLIEEMPNMCSKIMYVLDDNFKVITNTVFFNMYAYIIFSDIDKDLYDKYIKYTKGAIIRNKKNGKRYKILTGSESHPLVMSDIVFNEYYSNFASIRRIDANGKFIGKTKDIDHITMKYELVD